MGIYVLVRRFRNLCAGDVCHTNGGCVMPAKQRFIRIQCSFLCLTQQCLYNLQSRFRFSIAVVVMRWRFGVFDVLSFTEL